MKKRFVFGILALLVFMFVLAGCTTGKAYGNETAQPPQTTYLYDTNIKGNLYVSDNVGIGTANPEVKFHVEGNAPSIRIEDAGWQSWDIRSARGNLVFMRGEGTVKVMTLAESGKLQMKSSDGKFWCCGPANGGAWNCANTTNC